MSTRLTLIGVALIVLCSAVFYYYDQFNDDPATSISIYDKPSSVFVVPADQWYDFDLRILPPRGWAMVPPEVSTQKRPFVGPPSDFLGSQACAECHAERHASFSKTAHHKTSRPPSEQSIHGKFSDDRNELKTQFADLRFEMTREDEGFSQSLYFEEDGKTYSQRFPFGVVIGSGKIAQTYLHWVENDSYQMHVSYFRDNEHWTNSPGYPDGTADFARPALPRCFECHVTYIASEPGSVNSYDKESLIHGVSCERCHGPGRDHVEHHRSHPTSDAASFITNPHTLSRERNIDICSQCHSGGGESLTPPFSFRPGDKLAQHLKLEAASSAGGSVHAGNQRVRMQLSRCYTESDTLSCASCHDPHVEERGNTVLFSERCIKCHQPDACGLSEKLGTGIRENCIDCHMRLRDDEGTRVETPNQVRFPQLRDHLIAVWPEMDVDSFKPSSVKDSDP